MRIAQERPLRIALFSDSALPILNGVSVSVDALMRELRGRGHHVSLFASRFPGHEEEDPSIHRIVSVRSPFAPDYPLAVPILESRKPEFAEGDFDVVHTHTPFPLGLLGSYWAKDYGVPIVSTFHTLYDRYAHYAKLMPEPIVKKAILAHCKGYYRKVAAVITPSEHSRSWLREIGVETPIEVIPTGVPTPKEFDRQQVRRELGAKPEEVVVLSVGRLAPEKNVETLIRAAQGFLLDRANVQVWILGDGPEREEYEDLTRKVGLVGRVRFLGAVPREDVDRHYAAADVFAFASHTETQGLVVNEAMSYGLPAVVCEGGATADAVTHGSDGFIAQDSPAAFADRVARLIDDAELREQMSKAALASSRRLTVPKMVDRVVAVYRRAIERAPNREAETIGTR